MKKLQTIAHTIPAALAMHAGQVEPLRNVSDRGRATETKINARVSQNSDALTDLPTTSGKVITPSAETFTLTYTVNQDKWGKAEQGRFDSLVTKEALETISRAELEELDGLQILRRRLVLPPTTEEMAERNRREKLDRELLKVLKRHVALTPIGKDYS